MQTDPIGYADDMNLYAYVGNNPINRTDPTGMTIVVKGDEQYKFEVNVDLVVISSKPGGSNLISYLENSAKVVTIEYTSGGNEAVGWLPGINNLNGSNSTVRYNPSNMNGGRDDSGSSVRPPYVGLGHELGHAQSFVSGTADLDDISAPGYGMPGTTPPSEINSIRQENIIRAEHGLTNRSSYYPSSNSSAPRK